MKKIVTVLGIIIVVLVHIAMLFSCKTKQIIQPAKEVVNTIEKVVTKTERDTIFIIEADSSYYNAWVECINNKPVLRNPITQEGNNSLKTPLVSLDLNGQLNVLCATENLELKARINELVTEINNTSSTTEYIPIEVVKPLTFFQKLFINLGMIFTLILLSLIVCGIVILVLKYYVRK